MPPAIEIDIIDVDNLMGPCGRGNPLEGRSARPLPPGQHDAPLSSDTRGQPLVCAKDPTGQSCRFRPLGATVRKFARGLPKNGEDMSLVSITAELASTDDRTSGPNQLGLRLLEDAL